MTLSDAHDSPDGGAMRRNAPSDLTAAAPAEVTQAEGGRRPAPSDRTQSAPADTTRSQPRGDAAGASDDAPQATLLGDELAPDDRPEDVTDVTLDMAPRERPAPSPVDDEHATLAGTVRGLRQGEKGWQLTGLDDYQLIAEVARGGMGVVYRARQKSLNRIVAVKMILAGHLASDDDVQRFRSEAEAAARLQHPNIVAIYEVGESDGRHFFSMQFVEGRSLAERIREQPMPIEDAAGCLRTVADAVDYAHVQGILHRDLKPSNILLDKDGIPHLTDFGVAKQIRSDSQLTATGTIIGTPGYMPPEQASGDKEVGRTADVYSLGAVLYDLLTGRPPFTAQKPTDVLMQVLHAEPVSPHVLNPSVPVDLSTICLKCLEKDPARRYATARELSEDLARWLTGQPIAARQIGRIERAWRWCKRSPVVASMAALLILVAIGAFVGVTAEWLIAQSALRQMQVAQSERASAQVEALLNAAPESLAAMLNQLRPEYEDIAGEARRRIGQSDLSDRDRLRLSLALLPGDPNQVDYLRARMLSVGLAELLALRDALAPYRDQLREGLWNVLDNEQAKGEERFSAALLLAGDDDAAAARAERWQALAPFLAARLLESVTSDPSKYEPLVAALRPARAALVPPLAATFRDRKQPQSVRAFATNILASYAADQPVELARLLVDSDPWQFLILRPTVSDSSTDAITELGAQLDSVPSAQPTDSDKETAARRRATAAVALAQLGKAERAWPLLVHGDDVRVRSHLVELFSLLKTRPELLTARLDEETDPSARRALLLALGSYAPASLAEPVRRDLIERCAKLFGSDPDAGIHAAAEWLLRHWGQAGLLADQALPPAAGEPRPPEWYVGPQGHTLAVIDGRTSATMGSPSSEQRRSVAEASHQMLIGRKFALATKEVTIEQFRKFAQATGSKMPPYTRRHSPDDNGPIIMINWYRAAQYCRWLSEQAGLGEDQMCYPPIDQIHEGMQPYPDYLERRGFRLPTEAEWEIACRAGSNTSRAFGGSEELLADYAWYMANSSDRAWPGGLQKPNDFGLFDMHGNVWEWCGDRWTSYWENPRGRDLPDLTVVDAATNRVLRGGSFDSAAKTVRSAFRDRFEKPQFGSDEIGFRVACTVPE